MISHKADPTQPSTLPFPCKKTKLANISSFFSTLPKGNVGRKVLLSEVKMPPMPTLKPEVVTTYHGIEVLNGEHLGPQMIRNMDEGKYERREVQSALLEVNATDAIIEMGAGAGIVGAIVAKNCKPKKTVSFEANKTLMDHIRRLYKHNKIDTHITVRNKIVLAEPNPPKSVDFFIRGNFLGSGMTITKGVENATKVSVPVVEWKKVKKKVSPTVLLMDIEGAELDFFRHADLSGISLIIVELHRHVYDRPSMREIREQRLVCQGFTEDRDTSGGGVFVFRRTEPAA